MDFNDKSIPHSDADLADARKIKKLQQITVSACKMTFNSSRLTRENVEHLFHIAALRYIAHERNDCGVLMAGYGSKDLFPAQAIISDGVFGGPLSIEEYYSVSNKNPGIFRLLAQNAPANTFIQGIDDGIRHLIAKLMEDLALEVVYMASPSRDSKPSAKLLKEVSSILATKQAQIDAFIAEQHTSRFESIIEFMPINEMAQLAEMMVKLTAFHSRIFDSQETVGGPVDVCAIDRNKNFSWIKKK